MLILKNLKNRNKISYLIVVSLLLMSCNLNMNYLNTLVAETPYMVLGSESATAPTFDGTNVNYPNQPLRVGTKFILADNSNNRVLIWNQVPTSATTPADVVLGQPDMHSRVPNFGGISNKSLFGPTGVASDGTKLAVTDAANYRILIWNTIPTTNFKEADVVLGQPDFTSTTPNNGGVSGSSFNWPYELESANGNLMLADYSNRRVLIWNSFPTAHFASADLALGQANLTSNVAAVTQTNIRGPDQIWSDGTKLLVADYSASRVLIWNSMPTTGNQPADLVLGQPNFTSSAANNGGISASSMHYPWGITSDGNKIVVLDSSNNRLLIWNTWPTTNGQAADVVWGQPNFTTNAANQGGTTPTALNLNFPIHAEYANGQLFISDNTNLRVLVFNGIPTSNSDVPAFAIGQTSFTTTETSIIPVTKRFADPRNISISGSYFAAADTAQNRILFWTSPFDSSRKNPQADIVLGQPDFISTLYNNGGRTARSLSWPLDVNIDNNKLFVSDSSNCRVAIWNTLPQVNHQDMDVVVGQANKTSASCAAQQGRFYYPKGLHVGNDRLAVADTANRILLWNTIPTADNTNANVVLGQPNFTSSTANNGGVSASSLNLGWENADVWTDGTKVAVTDTSNHRVLLWNSWPTSNQQAADLVLGQPNFTSNTANNGGISSATLNLPSAVHFDGSRLYVADTNNHRILIWNGWPTTLGQASDAVLGQPDFVSLTPQVIPNLNLLSVVQPLGITTDQNWLYRVDSNLNRIIGVPIVEFLSF